jgi:hypothetical protein
MSTTIKPLVRKSRKLNKSKFSSISAARGIRSKGSTVWDDRGVFRWISSRGWGRIQIIEHLGKSFIEVD